MKPWLLLFAVPAVALAADPTNIAEDDASQSAYGSEWKADTNGGAGFGAWILQTQSSGGDQSHAGNFIATPENNPDLNNVTINGKAFGFFANGTGFEAVAAFRSLSKPLGVGESFSFQMEHGRIEKKFDTDDPGTGSIGITLRNGNQSGAVDDYNKGARFEFGFYEGQDTYQVYDGQDDHDTKIPFTDLGLTIKLTLVTADTYDLEVTSLGDKKTTKLSGRKLGGSAGGTLDSFCIFDRDGEKYDAFFNKFQVTKDKP
jgi:hypothetical protein